jgi:hypothetical protein
MTEDEIKNRVKVKLDELTPDGETLAHPVDNYIDALLDESYNQLLLEVPAYLLPMSSIDENLVEYGVDFETSENNAYVPRPDDFIRVGRFKFSDWENEATRSITPDNPEYKVHQNTFLQGRSYRPIIIEIHAYLDTDTELKRYLKCLNIAGNDNVEYLYYIANDDITKLTDDLIDPLTWLNASKVFQAFEMFDQAKFSEQRYREFILINLR